MHDISDESNPTAKRVPRNVEDYGLVDRMSVDQCWIASLLVAILPTPKNVKPHNILPGTSGAFSCVPFLALRNKHVNIQLNEKYVETSGYCQKYMRSLLGLNVKGVGIRKVQTTDSRLPENGMPGKRKVTRSTPDSQFGFWTRKMKDFSFSLRISH